MKGRRRPLLLRRMEQLAFPFLTERGPPLPTFGENPKSWSAEAVPNDRDTTRGFFASAAKQTAKQNPNQTEASAGKQTAARGFPATAESPENQTHPDFGREFAPAGFAQSGPPGGKLRHSRHSRHPATSDKTLEGKALADRKALDAHIERVEWAADGGDGSVCEVMAAIVMRPEDARTIEAFQSENNSGVAE